ncbi:APC family permease [Pseudonocardia asaccharolytica]|uniref:Amino acid APC family transporter n=1 Tax=Pseudonocardia asaccharolytica DSM 44247 = NBRC 16224 TaxID=1123024 RepID=A0A511CXX4_9PSEU|nr:APC family permease [Pseudonocardia asaccharolytica]GEL17406.1 amino acid APC family transporter [Pseudonocardia asaccharolytica DSM 44247 = NBRC 16224]
MNDRAVRTEQPRLEKSLGTWSVFVAGVGLVVAASTLVSDFVGYFTIGLAFLIALLIAFLINLFLGLSCAELSTTYPRAGALYEYGAQAIPWRAASVITGMFLAFAFYGMFGLVGALEISAGSFGLQALFNATGSLTPWIVAMTVLAILPNLAHVRTMAIIEAIVLVGMLAIRWFFGAAGWTGFSNTGSWSASNWAGEIGVFEWSAILGALALAYWSFVGIEFVAPLAEETRNPRRNLPIGIVLGLLAILATSAFMGTGVGGTQPLGQWAESALGPAGCDGSCPQLVVGAAMFGDWGRGLMALGTAAATYTSMVIVLAAMPRILYGVARDGHFFGPLSRAFAYLHPRFRTPWVAIFATAALYCIVAIFFHDVVALIFAGSYAWVIIYIFWHLLVIISRFTNPHVDRPFRLPLVVPIIGAGGTGFALYYAFQGAHATYGIMSLYIFAGSLLAALISYALARKAPRPAPVDEGGRSG